MGEAVLLLRHRPRPPLVHQQPLEQVLGNGQEAVDQSPELKPDVVLMDLNMPGLGGLSATEILLEMYDYA